MTALLLAAAWIAGNYERPASEEVQLFFKDAPATVLHCSFSAPSQKVARAVWRVAAPGMRDLYVNGSRISSTALPPFTPYRKRVLEEIFNVAAFIRPGAENVLKVELGNGWYNLLPLPMWYCYDLRDHLPQGTPCVRAELEIEFADGSHLAIPTDAKWMAGDGRIIRNSIYTGVTEDRRLEVGDFKPAREVEGPSGEVVSASDFPKTVVYERWHAKKVSKVAADKYLVDFGVNFAGTYRAVLRNVPKDAKLLFRSGERVNDDGSVNVMTAVCGQIKNPSKGPFFDIAEQRDIFISNGESEAVFEPRFTFHVFRYLQIEGIGYEPVPDDFIAQAWSADVADASAFECSDPRLNNLHDVARRTFRSNLQSVQSDCPGREKFGYSGDIGGTCESFRCNYAMLPFYRKVVRDFLDEAADDGMITETAPFVGIASASVYPVAPARDAGGMQAGKGTRAAPIGWATGLPVLLDVIVRYDGDLNLLKEAYPTLKRFIDLVSARYPDDDLPRCLGDWIALEPADTKLTAIAHWFEFLTKTARFAKLLGKADEAQALAEHADRVKTKFRRDFVKPGGVVGTGKQGEYVFALYNGLLEEKDVAPAYANLKADIAAHGNALTVGLFGIQFLLEYLSSHGDAELAGEVVTHKGFPGYYFMIERGATTLWENWKEEKCLNHHSNCHPMLGSFEQWLMRYVLGIRIEKDAVGADKVTIEPHAVCGLKWAKGHLDTPRGRIEVSWKNVNGKLVVEKKLP